MNRTTWCRGPVLAASVLVVALVVVMMWIVLPAGRAAAHDGGRESQFVASINAARSSRGLAALQVHGPIAGTSCAWNHQMSASETLAHDPGLVAAADRAEPNWVRAGENVGVGFDAVSLHDAFMNSASHRKNILDVGYTHVGICVDTGTDGRIWTTHRFLQIASSPPPPPPPTAPPTTSPPVTSSTATTSTSSTTTSRLPTSSSSSTTSTTTDPSTTTTTTTTAPATTAPPDTANADQAAIVALPAAERANPAVVALFVIVTFSLAGATFVVGRRRRP